MTQDQRKWTEISIAYETEPDERTERQHDLAYCGICFAVKQQGIWEPYSPWGFHIAYTYIPRLLEPERAFYCDSISPRKQDFHRATFAAFMAALSAKDIKEMLDNE